MIKHFRHAIEETLPWLSSIGADPTGGMTRLLYSPEWLETQQQFKKRMAESGLETRFDDVGNLYGRLCGTQFPEQVILSGSHIDTVVNGGNLDGQFGALAAWLALDWLKATYGAPVPMNAELVAALTRLCETEQLNYRIMHSGAGHDAQIFAPRVPTCMIFVPSINGISHNPAERTNINDLAEGVKTLALMLHQLAWQK